MAVAQKPAQLLHISMTGDDQGTITVPLRLSVEQDLLDRLRPHTGGDPRYIPSSAKLRRSILRPGDDLSLICASSACRTPGPGVAAHIAGIASGRDAALDQRDADQRMVASDIRDNAAGSTRSTNASQPDPQMRHYGLSTKSFSRLERVGCFSLRSAFASI